LWPQNALQHDDVDDDDDAHDVVGVKAKELAMSTSEEKRMRELTYLDLVYKLGFIQQINAHGHNP